MLLDALPQRVRQKRRAEIKTQSRGYHVCLEKDEKAIKKIAVMSGVAEPG